MFDVWAVRPDGGVDIRIQYNEEKAEKALEELYGNCDVIITDVDELLIDLERKKVNHSTADNWFDEYVRHAPSSVSNSTAVFMK